MPRSHDWTTDDQCSIGYSGPLCVACAKNYVLYGGKCIACDGGSPLWAGVLALSLVALVLFIAVLIVLKRTTISEDRVEETRVSRLSGLISITISWLQILSAFTVTYKLAWPADFAAYSKGTGAIVNLEVLSLLSISNCAYRSRSSTNSVADNDAAHFRRRRRSAWLALKLSHGKKPGGDAYRMPAEKRLRRSPF